MNQKTFTWFIHRNLGDTMKFRHIVIIAIFIAVNAVIIRALFGENDAPIEDKKPSSFILNLKGKVFQPVSEKFETSGYGSVASFNTIDVISEVQGKISWGKTVLKPGTKVNKGNLLYAINNRELRFALRARKSSFINLIANALPDVKVDFDSEYDKWTNYLASIQLNDNLPTLPSWKSDKEKVFISSRQILTEYFSIKSQEEQLNKYSFNAPYSGMIKEVYVSEYSIVNPGSRLFTLIENNNFEIPVSFPINQKEKLTTGTVVRITHSDETPIGEGKIARISEVVDPNTQSITAYIQPEKTIHAVLTDGQYVKIYVPQKEVVNGMRVPYTTVNNNTVFIYNQKDSTLAQKSVTTVHENEEGIFISGLNEGEIVINQEVLNYTDTTKYSTTLK